VSTITGLEVLEIIFAISILETILSLMYAGLNDYCAHVNFMCPWICYCYNSHVHVHLYILRVATVPIIMFMFTLHILKFAISSCFTVDCNLLTYFIYIYMVCEVFRRNSRQIIWRFSFFFCN
jgi:hypothetical protein